MANKGLFKSIVGKLMPRTNALNEENAPAYRLNEKHALAQLAATGCLNATFYASAEAQLDKVLALAARVEPEFVARTALFARSQGRMKDLPALLCAVLSVRGPGLLAEVFERVIDSPKMLRNFVQILRSGAVGRKSLGSLPKRLVLQWLEARSDEAIFNASVGQAPSMADIVKMVHPRPSTPARQALYGYLIGRDCQAAALPEVVRQYEAFKAAEPKCRPAMPDVPFQMLTALELTKGQWQQIARNASWQTTRMNLNTFARHGVFENREMVRLVAGRLADRSQIERAGVLPYQLMVAYVNASADLPGEIREALQDAMEIALANVPRIDGKVFVFPDVSGSMHSPVTGVREGASTAVRCIDVAALVAAAILRANPDAEVVPFEAAVVKCPLNPRDTVLTNAAKLAALPAGGTNCSAPLAHLNAQRAVGDLVVYVSDNESWVDAPTYGRYGGSATETLKQWALFRARNPRAKMVCIDVQPYETTQAAERPGVINVAGFSDKVFDLIAAVARGEADAGYFVRQVEAQRL